jgi:hypothetical protein
MSRVGFEPRTSALELAKTVHVSDCAATVIGFLLIVLTVTYLQMSKIEELKDVVDFSQTGFLYCVCLLAGKDVYKTLHVRSTSKATYICFPCVLDGVEMQLVSLWMFSSACSLV